jgi:hypothetical protein
MAIRPVLPITVDCPNPPAHVDLVAIVAMLAAIAAVAVSWFQVNRDRDRERHQAEARARTAKLLIGAAYASSLVAIRELERSLQSPTRIDPIVSQAIQIRDNQQLAMIFQALLTIDATALPQGALKPVGDAQAAMVTLRNIVQGLSLARLSNPSDQANRLEDRMQVLKRAFEQLRGFVPFELEET